MRFKLFLILFILLIVTVFTDITFGEEEEVFFSLKERAGISWRNFPITLGFPVPRGNKTFSSPPKIVDSWNREIPSQAVLAGKWPQEGTPRWWLITFLGSVNSGSTTDYWIVPGGREQAAPKRYIQLFQEDEMFVLDNSLLRMEWQTNGSFLNRVWFNPSGRVEPSARNLLQESGRLFIKTKEGLFEGKNSSIEILESGPVRTVLLAKGAFYAEDKGLSSSVASEPDNRIKSGFTYEARLIFYADSSFINMDLTITNGELMDWVGVDEAWISLQQAKTNNPWEGNFSGGNRIKLNSQDEAALSVLDPERINWGGKAGALQKQQIEDVADLGWADLTGAHFGMAVGISNFWQQYPKALRFNGAGEIILDLIPKAAPVQWGRGVAKTHHLTLLFHTSKEQEVDKEMRGIINAPPVATLPTTWFNQAQVFYQPLMATGEYYTDELMVAAAFLEEKSKGDFLNLFGPPSRGDNINYNNWGIFNYGDIRIDFAPPRANQGKYWNNNQYDLPFLLFREFLKTQEPAFLEVGKTALLHLADVDLVHPSAADRISPGLDHIRSHRTGLLSEATDFSYAKNRGLLLGYYLLGDYRSLELAIKVANRICLVDGVNPDKPRSFGLGIIAALTGYEATGEEKYLFRARELTTELLEFIEENQANIPSDFIYQVGIALEGLLYFNLWYNDPELITVVHTILDRIIYDFWDPETGWIQNMGGLTLTAVLVEIYKVTGDQKYLEICESQLSRFVNSPEILNPRAVAVGYRNLSSLFTLTE